MKIFKSAIFSLMLVPNIFAMEERFVSASNYQAMDDVIEVLLNEGYTVESLIEIVLEHKEIGRVVYGQFLGRKVPVGMVRDQSIKKVRETFLHMAARNGSAEMIKKLISLGANVNAHNDLMRDRNYEYETPVQLAARRGHPKAVQILLDNGADINEAFAEAIKENQKEIVNITIHQNLNLNEGLKVAALYKNVEAVKILIQLGADVNYKDEILNLSVTYLGGPYSSKVSEAAQIVKILIDSGVNINATTCLYNSVSWQSVYCSELALGLSILQILIDAGVDINQIGESPNAKKKQTSLALVTERLRKYSKLSHTNSTHHNAISRCKALKKFLIEHGAKKDNLLFEAYGICKRNIPFVGS